MIGRGVFRKGLTTGLVCWHTFEPADISGTTSKDKSGNGCDGLLVGSPTSVTGKIGQALGFSGSTQYVQLGNPVALRFGGGSFTMASWIKTTAASGYVILNYSGGTDIAGTLTGYPTAHKAGMRFYTTVGSQNTGGTTTVDDGNWHHIAGIRDVGAGRNYVYTDGNLEGNNADPGGSTSTYAYNIAADAVDAVYYIGDIDEPRIYDRPLSTVEMKALAAMV